MRVFCPEHQKSFFAPRQSPIKCENRGHVLGELDFAGLGTSNSEFQWQYCCNCEHFCVINFDTNGLERCPVCTRRSSVLYICDRCYTVSFESNTPLQQKNFTLASEGTPFPCCPGCLQAASADLREHTCEEARVSFVTGLNSCPICTERLDIGPAFPSSVAQYLRRTKAANKVNVTFDYESELFVAVADGEFVLISNNDELGRTIVIPRSPRLETVREFYELYQDYYHCNTPSPGEINLSEPAVVIPTVDGWKLLSAGVFEAIPDRKKRTPIEPPVREQPQPAPIAQDNEQASRCAKCNTLIEAKYAFCWKCGHPRSDTTTEPEVQPKRPRMIVSTFEGDDEERTVQTEPRKGRGMFSWSDSEASSLPGKKNGSMLKLFSLGVGGLLIFALSLFVLLRSDSPATTAATPETSAQTVPTDPATKPVESTKTAEMKPASLQTPAAKAEDAALAQLRQLRLSAKEKDSSRILKDLAEKEKKFADDYRFPYERAKVFIADPSKDLYQKAFIALNRAAQKAISKGQAGEMLRNLVNDGDGDFQKLSHGHREWSQLQKALKKNDAGMLGENQGL